MNEHVPKIMRTKTDSAMRTKRPPTTQATHAIDVLPAAKAPAPMPEQEQRALVKLGDATRMLAEVRDAPSAKKLMDLAAAAAIYARKAKLGDEAVRYAMGVKLDAQRRLGQYLKGAPKATGTRSQLDGRDSSGGSAVVPPEESPIPTLAELGISKKESAESQRLADISDEQFERVKAGEIKPSVALREQKRATLSARIAALPAGKYRVIYADPPWKYGDERAGLEKEGTAAAAQYPTMPTADICTLTGADGRHVAELGADDAVLFMWATFPLLEDALRVVAAWGFDYKTAFVWDKQRSNIGNYHDARAELLMVCVRGSCPIEIDSRPKQVISIARGKHSAKPEEFRALIDQLYPTGPRVELFRRGEVPKGWIAWGNETESAA